MLPLSIKDRRIQQKVFNDYEGEYAKLSGDFSE
jgi:hypothetical protein